MKLTTLAFTASTLLSLPAYAFPKLNPEQMRRALEYNTRRDTSDDCPYAKAAKAKRDAVFNAEEQLIGKFQSDYA